MAVSSLGVRVKAGSVYCCVSPPAEGLARWAHSQGTVNGPDRCPWMLYTVVESSGTGLWPAGGPDCQLHYLPALNEGLLPLRTSISSLVSIYLTGFQRKYLYVNIHRVEHFTRDLL